jgi:hypothetical protein
MMEEIAREDSPLTISTSTPKKHPEEAKARSD